eukprot:CAMPEP_0116549236 /NCGR_PEP_ID=MMETSP0397-20121206/4764_1 /TAXON_ID=216820 /ORGANISM="Cyclophora tenuis, Strain ECT3854" /LENGTH=556 /DNA_ID=CAMNT_0004073943 /DNA_START=14 /DNA_END=1684 /DNA_ORIENTATION=-
MGGDDGLGRRVQALLDLLNAAGVDTVDNSGLDREVQRFNSELNRVSSSLPEDPQAWDKQVDKLVRQLRDSLRDTPERDALEQDGGKAQEEGYGNVSRSNPNNAQRNAQPPTQPQPPVQQQQDEQNRRQYLEREFSSTSYPKIGPGYSDTISVVSELTIPTVVPGAVPEEEDYGPPVVIDFSSSSKSEPKRDRRTQTTQLRPPSRRVVTRSGGAAAQRRQSYQATMAHLEASGTINNPSARNQAGSPNASGTTRNIPASSVQMTVNDFPSLNESSNFFEETAKPKRRENGRRSLLRKSNKYAAAVETASSRMLLRQNSVKNNATKSTKYSRRAQQQQQQQQQQQDSSMDLDGIMGSMGKDIGFIFQELNALDADTGGESKVRNTLGSVAKSLGGDLEWPKDQPASSSQQTDPVLIDEDGFLIGGKKDEGGAAFADFDAVPKDAFDNSFFNPPPAPSRRKKGGSRRASLTSADAKKSTSSPRRATMDMGAKPSRRASMGNKESRIDAVEYATKQRLDMLRQMAADNGDSTGLDSKIDFVEAETMKQIRRLRDRLGENN